MRRLLLLAAFAAVACGACAPKEETMTHLSNRVFALAEVQTVYMDSLLPEGRCPRTFQGDTLVTSDIGWWTSGFYPGVLWQMYSLTGKESFHDLAVKHTLPLAGLLDRETDHDIGFQLMCSFALWETKGAEKLAARFVPEAGIIRSWNWGAWNIPVIIDNMMNLELLMEYGDREIAEKHALTTARNHFRDDGTTFHLVDYADDGTVLGRQTVQGYADDSAWARGQAWALYGYAMMAREEQDPEFGNMDPPPPPGRRCPVLGFLPKRLPGRFRRGDHRRRPARPLAERSGPGSGKETGRGGGAHPPHSRFPRIPRRAPHQRRLPVEAWCRQHSRPFGGRCSPDLCRLLLPRGAAELSMDRKNRIDP